MRLATFEQYQAINEQLLVTNLIALVKNYKENPTVGDRTQVQKIKDYLTTTTEGNQMIMLTQRVLADSFPEQVLVYRGCARDAGTESDAGWSTDLGIALNFAASAYEGELNVGTVARQHILYYDGALPFKSVVGSWEQEIITQDFGDVKHLGCVDVADLEAGLDEDDSYENKGYASAELEELVEQQVKKIIEAGSW